MKYNILVISPYRQSPTDGWSASSRSFIRALNTTGNNITLRNIYMASNKGPIEQDLLDLENTKFDHYDIIFQRVIPSLVNWDNRFKQNIALPFFESQLPKYHPWINPLNTMDKIFVASKTEKTWLSKLVKAKVYNITEPVDINLYKQNHQPIAELSCDKSFKFYTICEAGERKNLSQLIKAYLSTFSINDNVILVIKTNQDITQDILKIKRSIRRFFQDGKYPPIFLLSHILPETVLQSLHKHCDCFILPSLGESICRPAIDALGYNNPVICTNNIGTSDFITDKYGWLVKSELTPCYIENPPIPEIYTSNEYFYNPSQSDLIRCMKEAYYNKSLYQYKRQNIKDSNIIENFKYESVGKELMKAIED